MSLFMSFLKLKNIKYNHLQSLTSKALKVARKLLFVINLRFTRDRSYCRKLRRGQYEILSVTNNIYELKRVTLKLSSANCFHSSPISFCHYMSLGKLKPVAGILKAANLHPCCSSASAVTACFTVCCPEALFDFIISAVKKIRSFGASGSAREWN